MGGLKPRWGVRQTAGYTARAAKGGRERYAARASGVKALPGPVFQPLPSPL
jgi:hypothetical protein